jgi:hypothetical protein
MHLLWPGWRWWWWLLIPFWWIWQAISLPYRSFAILSALYRHRGIFPGDGMVQEIDWLLRSSPLLSPHKHQLPETGLLRFYDVTYLQDPRTMPLFLIVTDVQSADIIAVSSIDPAYADFPIALAARASGGFRDSFNPNVFPIGFRPASMAESSRIFLPGFLGSITASRCGRAATLSLRNSPMYPGYMWGCGSRQAQPPIRLVSTAFCVP